MAFIDGWVPGGRAAVHHMRHASHKKDVRNLEGVREGYKSRIRSVAAEGRIVASRPSFPCYPRMPLYRKATEGILLDSRWFTLKLRKGSDGNESPVKDIIHYLVLIVETRHENSRELA